MLLSIDAYFGRSLFYKSVLSSLLWKHTYVRVTQCIESGTGLLQRGLAVATFRFMLVLLSLGNPVESIS